MKAYLDRDLLLLEGLLDLDPFLWLRLGDLDLFCLFDDFLSLLLCGDLASFFLFFAGDFESLAGDLGRSDACSRGQQGSAGCSGSVTADWDVPQPAALGEQHRGVTWLCVRELTR